MSTKSVSVTLHFKMSWCSKNYSGWKQVLKAAGKKYILKNLKKDIPNQHYDMLDERELLLSFIFFLKEKDFQI